MNDLPTRMELTAEWLSDRLEKNKAAAGGELKKSWLKNSPARLRWESYQRDIQRDEKHIDMLQIWAYWIRKGLTDGKDLAWS